MGPNTNPKKTVVDPMTTGAVERGPWEDFANPQQTDAGPWEDFAPAKQAEPEYSNIDPDMEAPASVRVQVGALDKPEDRLTAIRKHYPDAEPYKGDNFIMTDPQTGKVMIYNQPGWIPSGGDIASILPEIGEGIGAVGGAIGGGILGGTSGSVVPVVGTTTGAIGGGAVGAGLGATAGREATQRGLNWYYGNDDTRTAGEQIGDAAKTFGVNAVGEGIGAVAAPLLGQGIRKAATAVSDTVRAGPKRLVAGRADDAAQAGQRAADFRAIGVEPTAGMVNGNANTAIREQALAATRAGKPIQDRIGQAFDGINSETDRIIGGLTPQTMSRQELGQALKDQASAYKSASKARGDYLYDEAGRLTADAPAAGTNTRQFLETLQAERQGMTKSAALNDGKALDEVIRQTKAITDDLGAGINFNQLKEARTRIGRIANDPAVAQVTRDRAQGLYQAMAADMGATAEAVGGDALQAWKKANNRFRRTREADGVLNTKNTLDPILKAQTPEQAAEWVLGQVNKGGTRINAVRRQIERTEGGPELWNTLTGSTVERLGINRSGEFSPTRLLSGWRNLSDEAKNAMFHGTGRAQFRQDLDRLARVSENLKGYRGFDNHSGTAKAGAALGELNLADGKSLLAAAFGGPKAWAGMAVGKAASFGTTRWQAKLLTSPETVNWLSRIPQAQMQKGGLSAHLGQLAKVAADTSDNALAVAINDYLREVGYSDQ
ncbi:hypothetical protein [Rhizobium sp. 2MFCol3.1]|uniref:hypothetical protein n=1 Tax=Rhizobium sp. 2MFCol3.1 TaxID=1246459 RepID=UPI000364CE53|nr:hypothetical protein [Rhizobium sp. 2MFCol3.1]